jgi:hypothetical protein
MAFGSPPGGATTPEWERWDNSSSVVKPQGAYYLKPQICSQGWHEAGQHPKIVYVTIKIFRGGPSDRTLNSYREYIKQRV